MYDEFFKNRLYELRKQKGVSARDMSLSLGQNPAYINKIENGAALPSMTGFFYICEYFNIQPYEFFNEKICAPKKLNDLIEVAKNLDEKKLNHLIEFLK